MENFRAERFDLEFASLSLAVGLLRVVNKIRAMESKPPLSKKEFLVWLVDP